MSNRRTIIELVELNAVLCKKCGTIVTTIEADYDGTLETPCPVCHNKEENGTGKYGRLHSLISNPELWPDDWVWPKLKDKKEIKRFDLVMLNIEGDKHG